MRFKGVSLCIFFVSNYFIFFRKIFQKFDLDLCIGTCPAKFEFGQGHLAIFFEILVQNGTKFGTKISKKNNLKQKSCEDFIVLKINKSTKILMIP